MGSLVGPAPEAKSKIRTCPALAAVTSPREIISHCIGSFDLRQEAPNRQMPEFAFISRSATFPETLYRVVLVPSIQISIQNTGRRIDRCQKCTYEEKGHWNLRWETKAHYLVSLSSA